MFFKNKKYFLVADVGGTKTSLAIADINKDILYKKTYHSIEIKQFSDTLIEFMNLPECKVYKIEEACIGVAGPINSEKNYARLTNLNWTIDKDNILVRTHLHNVILLNDFEAIGYGIDTLKSENYNELTNLGRNSSGTIGIIGAGTGLGTCILPNFNGKHIPLASEGGHVDMPIYVDDKMDVQLQQYLIKRKLYRDVEDVVSGRGIINIYTFLLTQKVKHNPKIKSEISKKTNEEKPAYITKYALEDKDALCILTLELFIKYYARIARNFALTIKCSELIIAGGIAPKIISALQDVFMDEFVQHDVENMRKLLELIPIIVLIDPDIGLYGALNKLKT
jgi:glucokinase